MKKTIIALVIGMIIGLTMGCGSTANNAKAAPTSNGKLVEVDRINVDDYAQLIEFANTENNDSIYIYQDRHDGIGNACSNSK